MLSKESLEAIAKMIPAKTHYAVIASWEDVEETADDWDDMEHVHFCNDWESACDTKRMVEAEGLAAYIVEPEGEATEEE
jgi:hypothetical protein